MQLDKITAGDSLNFLVAGGAYPASAGWVLTYLLVPRAGGSPISFAATAEGADFRVALASATTANWPAGAYTWFRRVEKAGEKYTLDKGQLTIDPSPESLSAGYDGRSAARKALDDARAAFYAWDPTRKRYKIGEREMEFNSAGDILKKIQQLEAEVRDEEVREGRIDKISRRIHSRI